MKTRLGVLLTACVIVLSGCTGSAAVGDGRGGTPSSGPTEQAPEFAVTCPDWGASQPGAGGGAAPAELPDTPLTCLGDDSQQIALSGTPPRPTIVNLWASWCAPCRQEAPILEDFAAQADGKVDVVGVVSSDSRTNAVAFAADYDMTFPSVLDPDGAVSTALALPALPGSVLVDEDGTVVDVHIGPFTSVEQIAALIKDTLGVTI